MSLVERHHKRLNCLLSHLGAPSPSYRLARDFLEIDISALNLKPLFPVWQTFAGSLNSSCSIVGGTNDEELHCWSGGSFSVIFILSPPSANTGASIQTDELVCHKTYKNKRTATRAVGTMQVWVKHFRRPSKLSCLNYAGSKCVSTILFCFLDLPKTTSAVCLWFTFAFLFCFWSLMSSPPPLTRGT